MPMDIRGMRDFFGCKITLLLWLWWRCVGCFLDEPGTLNNQFFKWLFQVGWFQYSKFIHKKWLEITKHPWKTWLFPVPGRIYTSHKWLKETWSALQCLQWICPFWGDFCSKHHHFAAQKSIVVPLSGWWVQRFFMFTPTWGRFPFWLIFFKCFKIVYIHTSFFKEKKKQVVKKAILQKKSTNTPSDQPPP